MKVGLVGAGMMIQAVHLPHLRQMKGVEVAAIADVDVPLAERVAKACGIKRVYDSAQAMVDGETLDAVVVATSKQFHADASLPALDRGIPVFVEKPLEASVEKAQAMIDAADRSGTILMVGYMKRFDPSAQKLQTLLADGALGRVVHANVHNFGGNWTQGALGIDHLAIDFSDQADPPELAHDVKPSPANPKRNTAQETWQQIYNQWIEVWSHDINLVRACLGEAREITCVEHDSPRLALVQFERGRVMFQVGLINDGRMPWDEQLTFYGTSGRARLTFPAPLLLRQPTELVVETAQAVTLPRTPHGEAFQRQLVHFFRCVANQCAPLTTGEDAIRDLQLCEAIARSSPAPSQTILTEDVQTSSRA